MFSNSFFFFLVGIASVTLISAAQGQSPTSNTTPSSAVAQEKPVPPTSEDKESIFVMCKRGKESRWLRAFKTNGRCKTYYSKEGYLQVVSSATYFSSCEAVLNNVQSNLLEGGFKCSARDINGIDEIE